MSHTYDQIVDFVHKLSGEQDHLDTYLLVSTLSADKDAYDDAVIRFVTFGYQLGDHERGRVLTEEESIYNSETAEKFSKNYTDIDAHSMSLLHSVLRQASISHMETVCRRAIELLFAVGYNMCREANGQATDTPPAPDPMLTIKSDSEDEFDVSLLSDDFAEFLRNL